MVWSSLGETWNVAASDLGEASTTPVRGNINMLEQTLFSLEIIIFDRLVHQRFSVGKPI